MRGLCDSGRQRAVNAPGGCSGVPLVGSGTLLAVPSGSRSTLGNATASSTRASAGTRAALRLTSASSSRTGSCFSQNCGSLSPALTNFPLLACTAGGTQAAQHTESGPSMLTKPTRKTAHSPDTSMDFYGIAGTILHGSGPAKGGLAHLLPQLLSACLGKVNVTEDLHQGIRASHAAKYNSASCLLAAGACTALVANDSCCSKFWHLSQVVATSHT